MRWSQRTLELAKMLPDCENDDEDETNDKRCHDVRIIRGIQTGPNDAHEYRYSTCREEEHAQVVDLFENLGG